MKITEIWYSKIFLNLKMGMHEKWITNIKNQIESRNIEDQYLQEWYARVPLYIKFLILYKPINWETYCKILYNTVRENYRESSPVQLLTFQMTEALIQKHMVNYDFVKIT